jgi:hypothetical protein
MRVDNTFGAGKLASIFVTGLISSQNLVLYNTFKRVSFGQLLISSTLAIFFADRFHTPCYLILFNLKLI